MQRIAVVCGAGASSTFLVHWMRRVADADGLPVVISANSLDDLTAHPVDADVILLGSHLGTDARAVEDAVASSGARVAVLPPLGFDAAGAAEALRIATELIEPATSASLRQNDQDRN